MKQTITVTGVGSAAAAPGVAIVDLGVEVLGKSVAAARSAATADMSALVESLRHSGVGDASIVTTSYSINPEYDHRDGRRLRGYRVTNMVAATIKDLDRLGETIDAAAAAGAEHAVVMGLRFAHEDDTLLATQARKDAWADARAKAEQHAGLAGVALGSVVSVAEQGGGGGGMPIRAMAMEAAMSTPVQTGELAVSVAVLVEFEIAPGS